MYRPPHNLISFRRPEVVLYMYFGHRAVNLEIKVCDTYCYI